MTVRKAAKILLYGVAGLLTLVLLLMLGIKLAIDRAPAYQSQIKAWVHEQTGYHIAFARVSPSLRWYGPELHFDQLELRSKDDRRVLARADGGRVAADIWRLISSGKLLAARIELDTPHIVITRLGSSSFALASEILLDSDESSPALRLDDLPAGKLAIRHAVVTMQNWNDALPELSLEEVNLDVRRDSGEVALLVNARLPPALGGIVDISASARGSGEWQSLDWTGLVRARDISFPGWRRLLPQYLSRLDAGAGGFVLAARGHGRSLARADLDFGARGVATKLRDGPLVTFEQIGGALTMTHSSDRWSLSGKRVRALRGGHADPDSEFAVSWRGAADGLLELSARASYLRVETLLPLTGLLPEKDLRDRFGELAPTGEWIDAAVALTRVAAADPWKMQVRAKFRRVGFAPFGRTPGLRGLSGSVAGTESGGRVDIDAHRALLTWPTQFLQPVEVEALKTTLYWKRGAEGLLVATPDWQMSNRDAEVRAKVAWAEPADGSSPILTLASTINNGNVSQVRNYLPRERLAPPAVAWLSRAFAAGRMPHADVVIQGPIRHFPFRDGSGTFLARCTLEGVTLDYSDGWPRVEGLAAQAEFRNEGMTARFLSGRVGGVPVTAAEARFADFKTGELQIHITAAGDASDALGFLRATPLDAATDHAFSGVEAKGAMKAQVELFLPFKDFIHRRILVESNLEGVTLNRSGSAIVASDVRGGFGLDGGQVAHADLRGRLLGGSFQMQARTSQNRPVSRTQLDFRGTLTGDALRTALALPAGIAIGGQSEWRAVLKMMPEPARERSLRISSNLVGLEMKLPAPLEKSAGTPLSSWVEVQWPAGGGPQGRLALGSVVRGSFALESDGSGLRLAHASLTFGADEASSSDSQILNLGGSVARLDLAGWLRLGTSDKSSKPLATYLRKATLNVAELDYLGFAFRDVALELAAAPEGNLRIAVGGPNVVGTVNIAGAANASEPLNLKFERLHFDAVPPRSAPDADHVSDDAPAPVNPRSIPAINFHAADLAVGERRFGDVQATLVRLDDGISLKQASIQGTKFTATVKGEWRGADAGLARIEGTVKSTDVQETLKELGYAPVLDAKSGTMDFDLTWAGAPSEDALSKATGRVQIALGEGQIVGINPGAGRVLGLTSVAALRRRLALDFSDLTDKGLAFDTATGDFDLRDGSAYTDNVLVKGPAAEIGLIGRIGLKNKDYDQTAVVTGSVSSSLPLAALAGGPVIGAAVLVFTQVFKQSLKGLARGYYRITGSWDNPTVERIKSAAAAAEAPK